MIKEDELGKRTTFRDRQQLVESGREPSPVSQSSGPRQPRDPGRRPAGYGDGMLWAMAERFEQQAYENRVSLGGRGTPYIYKALAQSAERSGIRDMKHRDGNGNVVQGAELGVRLVNFFWDHAPWDRDGDLIAQFADPMMFEDCLAELVTRWSNRRAHLAIQARRKAREEAGDEPEQFHRVPKPAIGYKTMRRGS